MNCPYCNQNCSSTNYGGVCENCYGSPAFCKWDPEYYDGCSPELQKSFFEVDFVGKNLSSIIKTTNQTTDQLHFALYTPNNNLLIVNLKYGKKYSFNMLPPFSPEVLSQIVERLNQLKVFS